MAIANSDGSIILSTKVDTSGINKGMSQMQGKAASLTKTFSKLGAAIASAFAIQKIVQFSNEAGQLATQTEASVQRLVDIYGSASDSVGDFIDQNARALGMSKAAAASFSSVYGNLFSVWADQATNAELTNRYLNMTAVVASKTSRTVEDAQERVRSGLLGNTEAIEDLGIFVNVKTIEMTDAFQRMADGKSWEQLDAYTQQQIRSMAILEQATAKYGDEVADTSATIRNRFNAAYQDFQNTWGQFINIVLLPILEVLTQVFDIATKGMNALMGKSGNVLEDAEANKDASKETADNIKEQADNQKELNDQMKKTLAGFDDIQILSAGTAKTTQPPPDVDNITGGGGTAPDGSAYVNEANETLGAIMGIVGFALAALGIILLCFGQIGWGIGFLIAGAGIFAVSQAALGEGVAEQSKNMLNIIVAIASAALLALGIILLFTPASMPLAIGMIIAGAAGLVAEAVINWDWIVEQMQGTFGKIMAIVSAGLLVLGIILVCCGIIPLGIGLIIAGAAGLATVVAFNWDAIVNWISGAWDAVKGFWNRYIAPVFTAVFWLALAKTCGNGLIGGFEAAINGIIGMFEKMINWIVDGLNKISFDVPDWVPLIGGSKFGFNIPKANFGRVSIPRLAQGTVVPPNKEFMAVLGDNTKEHEIVSPLSTIQEAVSAVVNSQNEETQSILREILEAILGIQIGDDVIGRALQRYNSSMIKMYGG